MLQRQPVAVLYAGGRRTDFKNRTGYERWFKQFFELHMVAHTTPFFIQGKALPDQLDYTTRATRRIVREWNKYNGFVVTLPPQQYLLTANLISFLLGPVGKPVVFVTAPYNPKERDAEQLDVGFKAHLMNAVQAAQMPIAGCGIMSGPLFIPATHAVAVEDEEGVQWKTAKHVLGRMDFGMHVTDNAQFSNPKQKVHARIECATELVWVKPGATLGPLTASTAVVVLEGDAAVSGDMLKSVRKQAPNACVVLLPGSGDISVYLKDHRVPVEHMTPHAVVAKIMWIIGQLRAAKKKVSASEVQKRLEESVIEENV